MSLSLYKKKRSFSDTPEPEGNKTKKISNALLFVVQKHHASHLHYDFRLEMRGVLKSWAVPKGPSMNPADKRLAMHVEDHPFDYKDFEGTIPKGNYGAGTVIVWDNGTYFPVEGSSIEEQQKILVRDYHKGRLSIVLEGKKLKGEFSLVRMNDRGENAWLLIKKKDRYASTADITKKDKSILSKKTIEQVKASKGSKQWISNRDSKGNLKKDPTKTKKSKRSKGVKAGKPIRKPLLDPAEKNHTKKIGGHEVKFSNTNKIYWPKEKITKGDMLNYYYQVAPYILPYMKDRPQSLNRHPDGIQGPAFYQKNVAGTVPSWLATHNYKNTTKEGTKKFLVCTDEASLLYIANLGCIEMNPWHSRVQHPDYPDWCVIDLDPDTNPFSQVIEAANVIQKILDAAGIPSYPKTSGSTGIHIFIPLGAKYSYDQSKMLAELIVSMAHHEIPSFTSLERSPARRKGKIYLDFLQNRPIQTIAAPYSLRPKPGATVSAPLHWEEVKPGLSMKDFTIHNMPDRIKDQGDIFSDVLGKGIDLQKVLKNIERLSG